MAQHTSEVGFVGTPSEASQGLEPAAGPHRIGLEITIETGDSTTAHFFGKMSQRGVGESHRDAAAALDEPDKVSKAQLAA